MHKKILNTTLVLFSILLSSCYSDIRGLPDEHKIPLAKNESYVKPEDVDYQNLSYNDYSEAVNASEVVNKINNKESFVLFSHAVTCGGCNKIKGSFMRYICSTKYVFTTLAYAEYVNDIVVSNIDDIAYHLSGLYPEHFAKISDGMLATGTPYLYFFYEGEMIADTKLPSKCFNSYQYFKTFLNSYIKAK